MLDVLAHHDVRASFFVLGSRLESPDCVRVAERALAEGHWIGNHSWSHEIPLGTDSRPDAVEREIAATERLLDRLHSGTAERVIASRRSFAALASSDDRHDRLFRPFGGGGKIGHHLLSPAAVDYLSANRYTCVLWNCVPEDWVDQDAWVERALNDCAAMPWTLIVLHDYLPIATTHLDRFIGAARAAGHRFRQDFPPACVPIRDGVVMADISAIVAVTRASL